MVPTSSPVILSRWFLSLFIGAMFIAGCQTPAPVPESSPEVLPPLPPLPVSGSARYLVDGKLSDVRILVYRGGPLAKAGHNHVVRVHELRGDLYLAVPFPESGFELSFPVSALEVDPPDARGDEGVEFATALSPQAIAATFKNMSGSAILDAAKYPEVALRSVAFTGPTWGPEVTVRVSMHGRERDLVVPVAICMDGDVMTVTGLMRLRTSDFGMTPFSVLGGGLQVQDEVKIRARIVANRIN